MIVVSIISHVTQLTATQPMLLLLTQVAPGQNPLILQRLALKGATVAFLQMFHQFPVQPVVNFPLRAYGSKNIHSVVSGIKGSHGWNILKSQILCFVSLVVFLQKGQEGLMRHLF